MGVFRKLSLTSVDHKSLNLAFLKSCPQPTFKRPSNARLFEKIHWKRWQPLSIATASNLLLVNLQHVAISHPEGIGSVLWLDAVSVKHEATRANGLALSVAEGAH